MSSSIQRPVLSVLVLGAALALAMSACDRRAEGEGGDLSPVTGATTPAPTDTPPSDPASGTATASTLAGDATAQVGLTAADTAFLTEATKANEEEIATTELGMSRGNAGNKALSRMLNADHVALRGKVAALAPALPAPPPPPAPAALGSATDAGFDAALLATYRKQHEGAIAKFEAASNDSALSEPVRALARETLPKLVAHLEEVKAQDAR